MQKLRELRFRVSSQRARGAASKPETPRLWLLDDSGAADDGFLPTDYDDLDDAHDSSR